MIRESICTIVLPGNSNVDSLEKLSVTPFLNWFAFFHSDQANPGGGPDKEEEGGEDDDAERCEGDQAQGPLPVKGQGRGRERGNVSWFWHL